MFSKLILFVILAEFWYLPVNITAVQLTAEEAKEVYVKFIITNYEDCKHTVSQETYEIALDGIDPNNEEAAAYSACVFRVRGWVVNSKILVDKVLDDFIEIRPQPAEPHELMAAKIYANICKAESERYKDEVETVYRFIKCLGDRAQSRY